MTEVEPTFKVVAGHVLRELAASPETHPVFLSTRQNSEL